MKTNQTHRSPSTVGFSLIEVTVTLTILTIIAAGSIFAVTGTRTASKETKLDSQVRQLNGAVSVYKAGGGSLKGI